MTPASAYLARRKKRYPPRDGFDRAERLFQMLEPDLPRALRDAYSTGVLAIGEVGESRPDVWMDRLDGDGFFIEFFSGMHDFIYAVLRAFAGVTIRHTSSGPVNTAALGLPDVVSEVARTFRQWARYTRWPWLWGRISRPDFPVAENIQRLTDTLTESTELFMLAHELGHVAIDLGVYPLISKNTEPNADSCGLQLFLPSAEKAFGLRRAFFGAAFSVRVFAGLRSLGVSFSTEYPPLEERLKDLMMGLRSYCPNEQYFHEASTVMIAYQSMMDDVDKRIDKRAKASLPDAERRVIRAIAELEDVALGRRSKAAFIASLTRDSTQVSPEVMQQIAATLSHYYLDKPTTDGFTPFELRLGMNNWLFAIIPELPERVRKFF